VSSAPIDAIDALYRTAVTAGAGLDDDELRRWMEEASFSFEGRIDRAAGRALGKAARNARRLARYWAADEHDPERLPDWRNGVDEVLGGSGWRPQLDLARRELEVAPSPDAFDAVKRWFRAVHFAEWMEGVSYEQWAGGG
jgi:hypothetical protein